MAADYKPRYSSTVFACDQSPDTRYIRCDFPQCSEHGQAKPSWMLNTLKNVRLLENHVGKEIHNFMKHQPSQCIFAESQHKTESRKIIDAKQLPNGTKKVLAVFSLKDSQSQLGDWLAHFLDAAFLSEYGIDSNHQGTKRKDLEVITQDFVSRYELMQSISNLEFIKCCSPKVEVLCILSCHSSSQGQVFSCTPTDISKVHGFEEFCSLHDFILTCQDTLQDNLSAIHVSSCFALKLDCSHQDWPVDYSWLKTKLKCLITGSIKEVYETGSQVCDLYIVLNSILNWPLTPLTVESCQERLKKAIFFAKNEYFPDLAREMGLEVLDGNIAESKVLQQGHDDQVTPPIQVDSAVVVAFLVEQALATSIEDPSPSLALSEAITSNLNIRKASDIRCSYITLPISIDKVSPIRTKLYLKEKLNEIPVNDCRVLFVVLSPSLANPSTGLTDTVKMWSSSRGGNKVYGIHFQEISALQAYYVKNRLKEEEELCKINRVDGCEGKLEHITITGLVDNTDRNAQVAFPVLLYLIHLAIGENGYRQPRKRLASGIYSSKPLVPGTSHWTLEEVYMETCHVLSGLARKCSLQLLSLPDTTKVTMEAKSNDHSVPYCSTIDDKSVVLRERPSSSAGVGVPSGLAETGQGNSCRTAVQQCLIENDCTEKLTQQAQYITGSPMRKRVVDEVDIDDDDDDTDGDDKVHILEARKKLKEEFLESCRSRNRVTSEVQGDMDSCALNMNTNNKGASNIPTVGTSSLMNYISSTMNHAEQSQFLKVSGSSKDKDDDAEIIVVDGTDCVSNDDSNSKGIQANFAPIDPHTIFPVHLPRNVDNLKRVNVADLDTFIPGDQRSEKKTTPSKKKRKMKSAHENNKTIQHFPKSDKQTWQSNPENSIQSSSCSIDEQEASKYELVLGEKSVESPVQFILSSDEQQGSTEEIPLLANVDEVLVTHYVLDLSVHFDLQVMTGSIVLFIEPASEEAAKKSFHLCLDSTLVNIQSVNEVFLPDDFKVPYFRKTKDQSDTTSPRVNVQETTDNKGLHKTVIEILDDDDGDNQSPDQSDAAVVTSSNVTNDDTSSSLFQRLQQNYGFALNDEKSSTPTGNLSTNKTDKSLSGQSSSSTPMDTGASSTSASSLPEFLNLLSGTSSSQQPLSYKGLKYSVYGWCVKVNKEGATGKDWPRCICIKYQTSPEGQSLTWTKDQDGRPCVFSPGAYINNRSLMPCQEPPVAMSTWQATIRVPKGCMVYMSGYQVHEIRENALLGEVTHYYEMDTPLPCSTLALAVGWFTHREGPSAFVPTTQGYHRSIPCRIIATPSLVEQASAQLINYASKYLVEACKLLGPYPFDRLDLLILPRCFACMGLKSPNLAFLSQSILSSDGGLRVRVAHEITHAWFGLLIGAKDWTEEWLSEGFATYLEDTVQSRAENWTEEQDQQNREIRQVLRYRTLSAEMQVTDKDMQCLRPKKTLVNKVERAEETTSPPGGDQPAPSTIIKYKCSKKWTQVHYLKGYFLLIHMENMVGRKPFEELLHDYVQYYRGQLVTSEDFFGYFMKKFPMLEGVVQDNFIREWLEGSGIPKCLRRKKFASNDNVLVNQALQEFDFWRRYDLSNKKTKQKNARAGIDPQNIQLESSEQIVLMLEKMLQRDKVLPSTLKMMNKAYQFSSRNAEIRHRWCELIVKHKYAAELQDVRQFLIEDQGMGIYLFGELIISGQGKQRVLAEEVFQEIGPEMDRCTFKTVTDMLQGVD